MSKKMLIDANHPEETRVVVLEDNRVEDFDFEAADRRQLRGNIYLAKVTRVEPSLQAAFVEYGGNRHGFLAFSEIHPDYYQIPVADRQALIEELRQSSSEEEDAPEKATSKPARKRRSSRRKPAAEASSATQEDVAATDVATDVETAVETGQDVETAVETGQDAGISETPPSAATVEADNTPDSVPTSGGDTAETGFETPKTQDDEVAISDEVQSADTTSEATEPTALIPGEDAAADAAADTGAEPEALPKPSGPDSIAMASDHDETVYEDGNSEAAKSEDTISDAPTKVAAETEVTQAESAEIKAPDAPEAKDSNGETSVEEAQKSTTEVAPSGKSETNEAEEDNSQNIVAAEIVETPESEDDQEVSTSANTDDDDDGRGDVVIPKRIHQRYKIQEVIKRRQIILIQVVKEERGNKGAALTTYLSLAGRYCVLMPNTARGGGISRKITNGTDRARLREVAGSLSVPDGMGVILRTAGASRTKAEIKRDFEYLMRLWGSVRELTLRSEAPSLVYEEGSLIKRSVRDLYNKDVEEILVAGESGYKEAKSLMKLLMPSHAKNVQQYKDAAPIYTSHGVETQLDALFSPKVYLRSGGYLIINPTEALVSVDVNSGRATKEHNIEDTALQTNLEAAEEISRQLRLRDMAGLVVIDFIDMEEKRNNRAVEKCLKDSLKADRARIQIGRISHFGLLEMSRQRLRSGVLEGSTDMCPHCLGTGLLRSTSSTSLHILRTVENLLQDHDCARMTVKTSAEVALFILNDKRAHMRQLEDRFDSHITFEFDATLATGTYAVEIYADEETEKPHTVTVNSMAEIEQPSLNADNRKVRRKRKRRPDSPENEVATLEQSAAEEESVEAESETEDKTSEDKPKRRRRRSRRSKGVEGGSEAQEAQSTSEAASDDDAQSNSAEQTDEKTDADGDKPKRRRRSRGGRNRRNKPTNEVSPTTADADNRVEGSEDAPQSENSTQSKASDAGQAQSALAKSENDATSTPEISATSIQKAHSSETAEATETAAAGTQALEAAKSQPVVKDTQEAVTKETGAVQVEATTITEPAPASKPDPNRPIRKGWWQRRISSLSGE